jgi:hypothetical protein
MKNIHVLPTDKPSRLCYVICTEKATLTLFEDAMDKASRFFPQNIYITSDEEIKEGDWFITDKNTICKCVRVDWKYAYSIEAGSRSKNNCKKIILTTDQDLIADGIQAIDDEFLEWFVKNPSCEFVEVKKQYITPLGDVVDFCYDNERLNYKIIIPQEEPKQELEKELFELEQELDIPSHLRWHNSKPKQETVEEIAANLADPNLCKTDNRIAGAKWQAERMYSEEEVPTNLESVLAKITHQNDLGLSQWHEVVYYDNDDDKWCCYSGSKTFQDGERVVAWKYCKDLI